MTLRALLTAYVLGGLTFLPLLAVCIIAALWYSSPVKDEEHGSKARSELSEGSQSNVRSPVEGAASATFAVLRRYDFQGATAAFKEASNAASQPETNGDGKAGGESVSVYQTMYRSVFDRNKGAINPLQEGEAQQDDVKAKARGKVFYIVLRHGHLMLYDSAVQFEVRHVISLTHYNVSLQDDIEDASTLLDAELFTKRTAIVLTPTDALDSISTTSRKPFFLFCDINSEKEDFYHALLSCIADPPIPRPIDAELAIKLQSAIHSNSISLEDRAINALLGRIFLGTHRTPFLEAFVRNKIEKKMARLPKPAFIASIACHSLNLGDAAPVISNLRLKEFNISGETVLSLDLKYTGSVNLTIAATAKLDLGQRFKTRMVSLLLAVVLQRLQGKMLIKIKPPPSNRIWFCFETMPDMELKIEPVVSSRQITYSFVLRAIEARIREAFAEGMVQPNWDDVPFFATTGQLWRGGIWESEGLQHDKEEELGRATAEEHALSVRNEKSSSTPTLVGAIDKDTDERIEGLKQRSTTSLASAQSAADKAWSTSSSPRPPRSVRSPSLATAKPLVAVDGFSADAVRADDASAAPARRRWMGRGNQTPTAKLDAAEAVRQVRDRDLSRTQLEDSEEHADAGSDDTSDPLEARRSSEPGAEGHVPVVRKTMTGFGSATTPRLSGRRDEGHVRRVSQDNGAPKKTILATTAAATNAAKQWTWNAVANRANRQQMWNKQRQNSQASSESASSAKEPAVLEPVGRGQPLPPPGMPLPGPQKTLWSAAAAGLGSMRKKPAPPRLPVRRAPDIADDKSISDTVSRRSLDTEGEFGPWMANDEEAMHDAGRDEIEPAEAEAPIAEAEKPAKKVPPPLPRRREVPSSRPVEALSSPALDAALSAVAHDTITTQGSTTDHGVLGEASGSHTNEAQSPTPPDLIDLNDGHDFEHDDHDLDDTLTEADLQALEDDVQAIPAPVDAEAEESGVLELSEHSETLQQDSYANKVDHPSLVQLKSQDRVPDRVTEKANKPSIEPST